MSKNLERHEINVELCVNCKDHAYYLNHNEQQFTQIYEELKTLIEKYFPNFSINKNKLPQSFLLIHNKQFDECYFDTKTNKITIFPRIGAFEVFFNEMLIYSKLRTKKFPKIENIIENIQLLLSEIQNGDTTNLDKTQKKFLKTNKNLDELESSLTMNSLKHYHSNHNRFQGNFKFHNKNKLFFPKMDLNNMVFDEDFLNLSSTTSSKNKKIIRNFIEENRQNFKILRRNPNQNKIKASTSCPKKKLEGQTMNNKQQKKRNLSSQGAYTIYNKKTIGTKRIVNPFLIYQGKLKSQSIHEDLGENQKENMEIIKLTRDHSPNNYEHFNSNSNINNNNNESNESNENNKNIENNKNNEHNLPDNNVLIAEKHNNSCIEPQKIETINHSVQFSYDKFKSYIKSLEPLKAVHETQTKTRKFSDKNTQIKKICENQSTQYSIHQINKSSEAIPISNNQETQTKENSSKEAEIQFSTGNFKAFLKTLEPLKDSKITQTKTTRKSNKEIQINNKTSFENIGVQYSFNFLGLMEKSVETNQLPTKDEGVNMSQSFRKRQKSLNTEQKSCKDQGISMSNSFRRKFICEKKAALNKSMETDRKEEKVFVNKSIAISQNFSKNFMKETSTNTNVKENEKKIDKNCRMSEEFLKRQLPSRNNFMDKSIQKEEIEEKSRNIIEEKILKDQITSISQDFETLITKELNNKKNEKTFEEKEIQYSQEKPPIKEFEEKEMQTSQKQLVQGLMQTSIRSVKEKQIGNSVTEDFLLDTKKNEIFNQISSIKNDDTRGVYGINASIQVEDSFSLLNNQNPKKSIKIDQATSIPEFPAEKKIDKSTSVPAKEFLTKSTEIKPLNKEVSVQGSLNSEENSRLQPNNDAIQLKINQFTQMSHPFQKDEATIMSNDERIIEHPTEIFKKIDQLPQTMNSRYHKNHELEEGLEKSQPQLNNSQLIIVRNAHSLETLSPQYNKNKDNTFKSLRQSREKPMGYYDYNKKNDFSRNNLEISHGDRVIKSADYKKPLFYKEALKYRRKSGIYSSQKIISSRNVLIVLNEEDLKLIEGLLSFDGGKIERDFLKKEEKAFRQQVLLIVKELSGVKSMFAFNDAKELKAKINVHKIDEVFLSNLTELNFIEFQKLKENLKAGHIKEIFYMDEDFILGKIQNFKSPSNSILKESSPLKNLRKKCHSCENLQEKNENIHWRSSLRKDRFPPFVWKSQKKILNKIQNLIEKKETLPMTNSAKSSLNYKDLLEKELKMGGIATQSLDEICEMNFNEFKKYLIEKEKDLKALHHFVLVGVKMKFIKSAERFEFPKTKIDNENYFSFQKS